MSEDISREDALRMLQGMYRVKLTIVLAHKDQQDTRYAATMAETPAEATDATAELARTVIERMLRGFAG